MSSLSCGSRNRLIALSICLCAFLAFSTTLSADTFQFVVGNVSAGNLGNYTPTGGVSMPDGPYPGTLTDTTTSTVSPNSLFFCLTGNKSLNTTETGTEAAPSTPALEEAAFLASLMLTDAVADSVTVGTTGSGSGKYVTLTGTGGNISNFKTLLGPIQTAIWYVMGTLPSGDNWTTVSSITDTATKNLVTEAQADYTRYSYSNVQVFTTTSGGQNFISVDSLSSSVPEPGTMVLFGAGALLMGLGCSRRLLAKRSR